MDDNIDQPLSKDDYQEYETGHWRNLTKRKRGKGLRTLKNRVDRPDDNSIRKYLEDRVKKLKELYAQHEPPFEVVRDYDDPLVGPTGRTTHGLVEMNLEEGISPFDLDDFEEQMPRMGDYM